jgi:hypothetical protein
MYWMTGIRELWGTKDGYLGAKARRIQMLIFSMKKLPRCEGLMLFPLIGPISGHSDEHNCAIFSGLEIDASNRKINFKTWVDHSSLLALRIP